MPSGPGPPPLWPVFDGKPFGCSSRMSFVDGPFHAPVVSAFTPLRNMPLLSNVYARVPVGANASWFVSTRSWAVWVEAPERPAVSENSVHSLTYLDLLY